MSFNKLRTFCAAVVLVSGLTLISESICSNALAATKTYDEYLDSLGRRESGGDYASENYFGYLGKYQFGAQALITCRLYVGDGSNKNNWIGSMVARIDLQKGVV